MSPAKSRRKQPVPKVRDRREVLIAVGASAAVVLGTLLMIWLMRPGPSGTEGTGGILNRQPRAAWLVGIMLVAAIGFLWWAFSKQRDWRGKFIIIFLGGWFVLGLAGVLAGILWPGGLLRHTEPAPTLEDLEELTPSTAVGTESTAPTIPLPTLAPDTSVTTAVP